ncbi:GDSL esterase/lipase At5g55050 [Vigna radiata var. radiata]|uniref:GDSL esterase/lipase At5g55050 n=1 Tax=Vigna radiata var. radiata TaxID=3916 RepID=A0A1S3VZT2_VIGRR|nr:GDSL esterase/lipase At5g55050 [Vigna radiata var. radiata]
MVSRTLMKNSLLFLCFFIFFTLQLLEAQKPPGVYVFGDSLVDVGNNNYLPLSVEKAILPHYGIDFPTKKPTGRFTNGKNAADLIAEKLGLPTSPPYLSLLSKVNNSNKSMSFVSGVNFASGGAGIFNASDKGFMQSIPLQKQVDYYSQVHETLRQQVGASSLEKHLSKSIFIVVIGGNDIFGYFDSKDLQKKNTPQQYADSMASTLKLQLQRLYNNGAKKFEVAGVGPIGCCPAYRLKNKTECVSAANDLSAKYNEALQSMLKEWQLEKKDISYSYFDTYAALQDLIHNSTSYGFGNVKGACCGLGELNAQIPCLPISSICSNRQDHVFWDAFHPTEAASRIFVDEIFKGPSKFISPINMEQLLAI